MTHFPGKFSSKQNKKKRVQACQHQWMVRILMKPYICLLLHDSSDVVVMDLSPLNFKSSLFKYSYARKPNQNGISFYLYFLLQRKMKPSTAFILINEAQNSKEKLSTTDLSHLVTLCLHVKIKFYFKFKQRTPPAQQMLKWNLLWV